MIFTCQKIFVLVCIILFSQINHAHALSLLDAYEAALLHDPIYRSAFHENEAGQQAEAIGLASLLPNLSITHTQSKNTGTRELSGAAGAAGAQSLNFDSQVSSLTLRQPLINMEAVANYRQVKAQADSNRAKFNGRNQYIFVLIV